MWLWLCLCGALGIKSSIKAWKRWAKRGLRTGKGFIRKEIDFRRGTSSKFYQRFSAPYMIIFNLHASFFQVSDNCIWEFGFGYYIINIGNELIVVSRNGAFCSEKPPSVIKRCKVNFNYSFRECQQSGSKLNCNALPGDRPCFNLTQ